MPFETSRFETSLPKKERTEERKRYIVESGETIEILEREFFPESGEKGDQNVIFLPGWSMSAESGAVTALGQSFADRSASRAFAISSRMETEPGTEDVLLKEAEAIAAFIKEKGLTNIILAGHSQGGDKAIDLVSLLQNDPTINIQGLVLLDSVGLYDQSLGELTKNFTKDAMVNTPVTMARKIIENPKVASRGIAAGNAITQGIFNNLRKFGISGGVKRMREEVTSMAETNSRLSGVDIPVIIMSGSRDPVSNPDRIMPPEEEQKIIGEWKLEDEEKRDPTLRAREQYLQENTFPKSPYIRMLVPEKLGHHALPLLRAESIANASLYLLKRYERNKKREE